MKSNTYYFFLFWLFSGMFLIFNARVCHAQNGQGVLSEGVSLGYNGNEILVVEAGEIDLGEIIIGKPISFKIKLKNNSETALVIGNIRGSCGLSVPTWPRLPLQPGEEALIQFRVDARQLGLFRRNLIITANTYSSRSVIPIVAKVVESP